MTDSTDDVDGLEDLVIPRRRARPKRTADVGADPSVLDEAKALRSSHSRMASFAPKPRSYALAASA